MKGPVTPLRAAITVASIGALIDAHRELTPVLAEHIDDNDGEILPHLVMADVIRWLVDNRTTHPETCRAVFSWLEHEYLRGPAEVEELIALSGVEMIPDPGLPGSELRSMLGPELRAQDPWSGAL